MTRSSTDPPTTARPPFDPAEYARTAESGFLAHSDEKLTAQLPLAPPLNKLVRLAVPASDLAWFDLSPEALALCEHIDGTCTLLDLMEKPGLGTTLVTVSELHDADILTFEE